MLMKGELDFLTGSVKKIFLNLYFHFYFFAQKFWKKRLIENFWKAQDSFSY